MIAFNQKQIFPKFKNLSFLVTFEFMLFQKTITFSLIVLLKIFQDLVNFKRNIKLHFA